jgi:hypothetical protein
VEGNSHSRFSFEFSGETIRSLFARVSWFKSILAKVLALPLHLTVAIALPKTQLSISLVKISLKLNSKP